MCVFMCVSVFFYMFMNIHVGDRPGICILQQYNSFNSISMELQSAASRFRRQRLECGGLPSVSSIGLGHHA